MHCTRPSPASPVGGDDQAGCASAGHIDCSVAVLGDLKATPGALLSGGEAGKTSFESRTCRIDIADLSASSQQDPFDGAAIRSVKPNKGCMLLTSRTHVDWLLTGLFKPDVIDKPISPPRCHPCTKLRRECETGSAQSLTRGGLRVGESVTGLHHTRG